MLRRMYASDIYLVEERTAHREEASIFRAKIGNLGIFTSSLYSFAFAVCVMGSKRFRRFPGFAESFDKDKMNNPALYGQPISMIRHHNMGINNVN